jgi:hypothetical protein
MNKRRRIEALERRVRQLEADVALLWAELLVPWDEPPAAPEDSADAGEAYQVAVQGDEQGVTIAD